MPTIDLTDAEYAAVTALIKRAIEQRPVFPRPAPRAAALGAGEARHRAETKSRPTTANAIAGPRRKAGAPLAKLTGLRGTALARLGAIKTEKQISYGVPHSQREQAPPPVFIMVVKHMAPLA